MPSRPRALSTATVSVLRAISQGTTYGFDIMDETGLPSGTVYPILTRLERRGLLASRWEDPAVEREGGRPPRRYYTMTRAGEAALRSAVARFRELGRPLRESGS